MKTNENLQEILTALEQVRSERYPDIGQDILTEIVTVQFNNQEPDRRSSAKAETSKAIKKYLETVVQGG